MTDAHRHHGIDYLEFTAPDLEAVKKFYRTVFGWAFTDYGPDYVSFADSGLSGGFARGDARPGGPLTVLYSGDLEATLEAVRRAGAPILKEPYAFPGGRRFHFKDPGGNELAVWSA